MLLSVKFSIINLGRHLAGRIVESITMDHPDAVPASTGVIFRFKSSLERIDVEQEHPGPINEVR